MSTIPLPAMHLDPVQVPDFVGNYSRLLQLRNMVQSAPLQQQALQQQVQQGQLDIQQKQQALNDQKAATAAMQNWDGKDYNDILPLMIKNGASAQAIMGLKSKILEQQQSISTAMKNNADAAQAQANAVKTRGDLLDGTLSTLIDPKQVPDAQLPQALQQAAQDLAQKGVLDPQHAQQAAQLGQLPPDQIRSQLDLMRKSNLAQSQILDEAQKKAATEKDTAQASEANANTLRANAQARFYQQNGLIPGVSPDEAGLADYLRKNPGKGASDYLVWKAQHAPSIIAQGMSGGVAGAPGMQAPGGGTDWGKVAQRYGLSQAAFDQQAEKYFQTGQLPPIGRGNANVIAQNRDLMNRAAELHPNASLAENSAEFKASSDSLKKLQTNFDQVNAFESTAEKNLALLQQTAQNIPDLGARFANIPVRMVNSNMLGTENMARFKTALATAQTEAAKVLNSSNATGVLSDSARHELQDIVDGNAPYKAMVASLDTLRQDMTNRRTAYQDQISDIQKRLGKPGGGNSSAGNGGGMVTMRAPNGQTKTVSADQVEHYKQLGATVVQ